MSVTYPDYYISNLDPDRSTYAYLYKNKGNFYTNFITIGIGYDVTKLRFALFTNYAEPTLTENPPKNFEKNFRPYIYNKDREVYMIDSLNFSSTNYDIWLFVAIKNMS